MQKPNIDFIDASKSLYDQELYVIPDEINHANMSENLGYKNLTTIKLSQYGVVAGKDPPTDVWKQCSFSSLEGGVLGVASCFVRVNDLTIRSFNGVKSSRSNILYHIPRFSNDGTQYGELYFNAPEKTYIKLHNSDSLMLNQLKIDIVDRDEQVVDDLYGATIICLHIRQSK